MEKINFINDTTPALNATNLNKLQQNVEDDIGDLTQLETSAKNNLVEAINEAASTGSGGDTLPIYSIVDYDGDTVPTGYEEVNSYSTSEVKTGDTWIDGKPIYRKVINANMKCNGALTHGIVNLDLITDLKIIFKQDNDNFVILPKNTVEKEYTIGVDKYTSSIIQLSCGSYFANNQNYDFTFILEYTKTTD